MTMAYSRQVGMLRSLTQQLSCLTVRGFHQHVREMPKYIESSLHPDVAGILSNTSAEEVKNNSFQCSMHKMFYTEIFEKNQQLSGLPVNTYNRISDIKSKLKYDCPKISNLGVEISTPALKRTILPVVEPETSKIEKESPGTSTFEKFADKTLMRIRRQKMRKHQAKKRVARTWPVLRKLKYINKKKREKRLQSRIASILSYADNYHPLKEIKANLAYAKLKGYEHDLFNEKGQSFGFADVLKKKSDSKK